jgi:outer membrane protein insertion porin family
MVITTAAVKKRFNWLEYYKVKFKADTYTKIYGKLVLRLLTEFDFRSYNQDRGAVPFERYYLGGDGLANFAMDGRETFPITVIPQLLHLQMKENKLVEPA